MHATVALGALAALLPTISAHGYVAGIVSNGVYYPGGAPNNVYQNPVPKVAGWAANNLDNGFVAPDSYTSPDIICHKAATPGQAYVPVTAGQSIVLEWTPEWPLSHKGPVLDYLAPCANGDCTKVDKTTLQFFKLDAQGLISGSNPGTWATDNLIANNNSWTVRIPSNIKPGPYVLRHEILALHSAGSVNGAQNYPQCVNLQISGTGTGTASGVVGTKLYTETDPSIVFNLYSSFTSYKIPGPAVPAIFASASAKFRRTFGF